MFTPGFSSSQFSRVNTFTSTIMPYSPWGHAQRSIAHFSRLFTEDGAQQAFLCRQLRFSFGCYLADQDVPGTHLRANTNNTPLIQFFERIFATLGISRVISPRPVWYLSLRSHIPRYEWRYTHRRAQFFFIDEDRILVVVAFPSHKTDQRIFPKLISPLLVAGPSAITMPLVTLLTFFHNRALVDAGTLVGPHKFQNLVGLQCAFIGANHDFGSRTFSTTPLCLETTVTPESTAALYSMPVPTIGDSVFSSGTACRCMLEPISARLASSFSRKGIIAVATETTIFGETSIKSARSRSTSKSHHGSGH